MVSDVYLEGIMCTHMCTGLLVIVNCTHTGLEVSQFVVRI